MKNFIIAILIIALVGVVVYFISDGNISLDSVSFGSVNYDKAYRDMAAMLQSNPSLTIQESKNFLLEGFSTKDFFSLLKSDRQSSQLIQMYSLDVTQNTYKDYNIDFNNLIRALKE